MTLAVLASCALTGIDAPPVRVEVHLAPGLPSFTMVGLADTEVRESRERVRAALLSSGYEFPAGRVTVNLAPADLPKESGRFDLPIAIGVLLASGQIAMPALARRKSGNGMPPLARWVLAGELSLSGALVPVAGALAIALSVSRRQPGAELMLPAASARLAARVPGLNIYGAATLQDVVAQLEEKADLKVAATPDDAPVPAPLCLSDVRGQYSARRALEVAAGGGHNLLMLGPPGSGKTPALINSGGALWNAGYIDSIGDPSADLRSNIAAEARAKIVYERLINLTDDPGVKSALQFLMTREIAHQQSFEKALYSMTPNFPPGKLPGDPHFANVYFNMSQGEGDMRGSWNSDENFTYVTDRDEQCAVDGGDGYAEVGLTAEEQAAVEDLAARTVSDPDIDPTTGVELGSGEVR